MFSFCLITAFNGNKYFFIFVSNQIAVFHSEFPIFAVAFNRPQPSSSFLKLSLISSERFSGSEINTQLPGVL